ncbi:MAG: hypothetical protein PUP93_04485 [Rhizonema sp. NSF051]|nr:hypothetical protein [Rhizonema sp. NSF051]
MVPKINGLENSDTLPSQVELELLEALMKPDDGTYPWNPVDEESETYFLQLEQQFIIQDLLDEELNERSQALYNQLDHLWLNYKNDDGDIPTIAETQLHETLHKSFGSRIPEGWLDKIARKATEIFNSTQSINDRLVKCVQAVLPAWGSEDLLVFARSYTYATRSKAQENVEFVQNKVESSREWTTLSEIEQAKVSVAIAYHALTQLKNFQNED